MEAWITFHNGLDGVLIWQGLHEQSITHFVAQLNATFPTIPVKRIDERFTSKMASQVIAQSGKSKKEREKKEHIDLVSATIILQSYMESN